MKKITDDDLLIRECEKLVQAIGRMLAPFCEVALHDLRQPGHSVVAIETPLSGRKIGDATTEMGLARLAAADFPDIVQNYPNQFPDGRQAKSTSIGIRNGEGRTIAALCLNMDISALSLIQQSLGRMMAVEDRPPVSESLQPRKLSDIQAITDDHAAKLNLQAAGLDTKDRRELIATLQNHGLLEFRGAAGIIANQLNISRASFYNDLKAIEDHFSK